MRKQGHCASAYGVIAACFDGLPITEGSVTESQGG